MEKCETLTLIKYVCVLIICLCELKHDVSNSVCVLKSIPSVCA